MAQRLELNTELNTEQTLMTEIAVIESQLINLLKSVDELKADLKELKNLQTQKISDLEKRTVLLEERVARLNWIVNLITGVIITGIVGGLLSLIFKG